MRNDKKLELPEQFDRLRASARIVPCGQGTPKEPHPLQRDFPSLCEADCPYSGDDDSACLTDCPNLP